MLNVEKLTFAYPNRKLFADLSFHVRAQEVWHIKGANGAGKSTLFTVLVGLREATAGTLTFFNQEPGERSPEKVEYLPAEANNLYGKLSARQNLRFWSELRGIQSVHQMQEALHRWGFSHKYVQEVLPVEKFSTGMRRRLALARIMLSQAKLWILDEPIYGLDAQAVELFRTMLQQHVGTGGSALIISHDQPAVDGITTHSLTI